MTARLDARLKSIADFVPRGSRVADIGTDHAQLAIELIKSGRASKVIAADKNEGPLDAARKNIDAAALNDRIEIRLGDGLKVIRANEVDVVCIAGMGGALIAEILSDGVEDSIEHFILQPMNAVERVRHRLVLNGWIVIDEDLAEVGGIVYEIIFAGRADRSKAVEMTKRSQSPLLKKLLNGRIEKLKRIAAAMEKSPSAVNSEKYLKLRAELERQMIERDRGIGAASDGT